MLRLVPDSRIFEFAQNLLQLFLFAVVVKDTPGGNQRVAEDPRYASGKD